jgi:hypothetical protein
VTTTLPLASIFEHRIRNQPEQRKLASQPILHASRMTAVVVLQRIRQTLGDVLEGVPYLWLVGWGLLTYKYVQGR